MEALAEPVQRLGVVGRANAIDHNLSSKQSRGAGFHGIHMQLSLWNELVARSHGGGDSVTVKQVLISWEQAGCAL